MVQKVTIHSKEEVRVAISNLIARIKQECALPEEKEFCMKLVFNELVLNALINHAGKDDPVIDIWIKMDPQMDICKVLVSGNGPGFDATAFLKQMEQRPCDMMAESGRGLMLVKAHSQALKFNRKGNKALVILS